MSQKTMKDFFQPKRMQDGEASNLNPNPTSPQGGGKSDNDVTSGNLSSLEIDEQAGSSESSNSSQSDDSDFESMPKSTPKFSGMGLSKFTIRPAEQHERMNAETIIKSFMTRTSKKFKKGQKRKSRSRDRGQGKKKRSGGNTEQQQQQNSGNTTQQIITQYMEGTVLGDRQSQPASVSDELPPSGDAQQIPTGHKSDSQQSSASAEAQDSLQRQDIEQRYISPEDEDEPSVVETEGQRFSGRNVDTIELEQETVRSVAETELETIGREARELELREDVRDRIEEHPSGFSVKIYVLSTPSQPEMYTAMRSVIKPEQLIECKNVVSSFIIFFYRETDEGPDIFVMTSGQAYRHLTQRNCSKFPKKVAKCLLQFETIEIESRNVTGDTRQTRRLFLPDSACCVNIWDVMDAIINTFKAFPKDNSSIYNLSSFKTKRGRKKHTTLMIRPQSIMVNQSTTFEDMQEIFAHLSDIDKGKPTKSYGSRDLEEDDKQFQKMDYIQEEHNPNIRKQLRRNLERRIRRYFTTGKETGKGDIRLSMEDLKVWLKSDKYLLFLKRKQKPLKSWDCNPPMLRDIIEAVKHNTPFPKQKDKSKDWEWFSDNVQLAIQKGSTVGKRYPIINFLVGTFLTSDSKPYFLWHGKWLKMKMEFQNIVAENFREIINEAWIEHKEVLLLPWTSSNITSDERGKLLWKTMTFSLETLKEFLKTVDADGKYTTESVDKLLADLHVRVEKQTGEQEVCCEFNQKVYQKDDADKLFALLFVRLQSKLDEGMYNATYILLNQILARTSPTQQLGYIVGDKILSHNIEMFDILMYSKTHTYLVHVKEGFDHNIRDVCSQIRNSADLLWRALTSQSTHSILDESWRQLVREDSASSCTEKKSQVTSLKGKKFGLGNNVNASQSSIRANVGSEYATGMKHYKEAIQATVKNMGKAKFMELFTGNREIVYVLASRDGRMEDNILDTEDSTVKASLQKSFDKGLYTTIVQLLTKEKYLEKHNKEITQITDALMMKMTNKDHFVTLMKQAAKTSQMGRQNEHQREAWMSKTQHENISQEKLLLQSVKQRPNEQDSGYLTMCTATDMKSSGRENSLFDENSKMSDQSRDGSEYSDEYEMSGDSELSQHESINEQSMSGDTEQMETNSEAGDDSTDIEQLNMTESSVKTQCGNNFSYGQPTDKTWKKVYEILKRHLPKTKSTIARLELLSLFSHFRNYQIGMKKFQLKVCFLSKSTEDLGSVLETFLQRNK